jgi:hypothetical protein
LISWPLIAGLFAVPLADQGAKWAVRGALPGRRLSLGRFGCLEPCEARIWLGRSRRSPRWLTLCAIWLSAAWAVTAVSTFIPATSWFAGLLLGGTLSHLIETLVRGSITDFIRLKCWPAFNLADAAIAAGGIGFGATVLSALG